MKENRRYKRFDLLSALAVFGALFILLFECFFVFELYNRDIELLERFFPVTEAPASVPEAVEELAPVG